MNTQTTGATPDKAAPKRPTFKEPPRYRLLQKAFLTCKVKQGEEWVPYADVLLDPEEQPVVGLSGPFGGRGPVQRQPLIIEFAGIPDEHLEPLNDAAHYMMDHIDELKAHAATEAGKRRTKRGNNPIDALTVIGPGAVVANNEQPAT